MPNYTTDDFAGVTPEQLDDIQSSSFALSGQPGTPEHLEDVADALGYADGDIFYDTTHDAPATAATTHANVTRLQAATEYSARMMRALARNPDLLAQVVAAMDEQPAPKF